MKKFLLFAAAALMSLSASADWYLVGANFGWNVVNTAYTFEATSEANIFQLDLSTKAKKTLSGEFKITDGTWSNSFGGGSTVTVGQWSSVGKDGANLKLAGNVSVENAIIKINTATRQVLVEGPTAENEYSEVYLVGDFGSSWSEDNKNFPLTLKSGTNNVYEGTYNLTAGTSYFKMKAGTLVYGTGGSDIAVELGTEYTASQSGDAFYIGSGEYTFTYVLDKNAATGKLTVTGKEVLPETLYIIGNVNGEGWDPQNGIALTKEEGSYVFVGEGILIGTEGSEYGYFSFAQNLAADWADLGTRYGATSEDFEPQFDIENTIIGGQNSFKVEGDYKYDIVVNLENMTLIITAAPIGQLTLEASMPDSNEYVGEVYEEDGFWTAIIETSNEFAPITFTLPDGYDSMYYCDMYGGMSHKASGWITEEEALAENYVKGNVINVPADGKNHIYAIVLGANGLVDIENASLLGAKVSYNPTVSVEGIEIEENATYFNLQGVKVANPENGIFVKVVNGKAVKVAL